MNEIAKGNQTITLKLGRSIIQPEMGIVEIRGILKTICNRLGFPELDIIKILTAASEITRNIHDPTSNGTVIYEIAEEKGNKGLKLTFNNTGGAVPALDEKLSKKHRSREDSGSPLSGAKKLVDMFFINPMGEQGTAITVMKWLNSNIVLSDDLIEQLRLDIAQISDKSTIETLKTQNREILELLDELRQKYQQLEESNTQLTKVNEQLEILNVELEKRTEALKVAHEQMMRQEKLAAIGKLAGSVGHELRNPLGVITNSIYYLGLKFPVTDEKVKKHLKIIQDESAKANKIISELLDFARSKPDKLVSIELCQLIKDSLEQIQKPENITLNLCFEQDMPCIKVDPRKMLQVFQNIITNAYQAMPDGGTLSIQARNDAGEIEVGFKDTGIGIPPENLSRLFEPLFSTKIKGVGLGLSIAKEIVEQYKGTIEIESEVDVGSTVIVKLPCNV
ncbi:MAG TPA: ATP-binding protein [Candidatus Lokiarchaeia archaeon]|nr:ATP-binding protein [Candidatus Lokiarchaeia archaeon]